MMVRASPVAASIFFVLPSGRNVARLERQRNPGAAAAMRKYPGFRFIQSGCDSPLRTHAAALAQFDRAVGDGEPKRRADRAFDQADLAAMGADEFRRNGKP